MEGGIPVTSGHRCEARRPMVSCLLTLVLHQVTNLLATVNYQTCGLGRHRLPEPQPRGEKDPVK